MRKVYICAPLGGEIALNVERAKQYARFVLKKCGAASVVPHFYALLLDDTQPEEREMGRNAAKALLWFCDECWVFGDEITSGMREEIELCRHLNIKVRYISEREIKKTIGGVTI